MATPVKWFHDTFAGAPVLSGTAGALIDLLDACLVNGFNLRAVTSLTVASGVATLECGSGHGYVLHQIILVAGATPAGLNGEHRVTEVLATGVRFSVSGVADGAASGGISVKTAPVGGWEKVFAGSNKAVYRSLDSGATGLYLRVEDSSTTYATWNGYESMSDVDTGSGLFAGVYARKSDSANGGARSWTMVADARAFYLATRWKSSSSMYGTFAFGDIVSYKPGDAYHCAMVGDTVAGAASPGDYNSFPHLSGGSGRALARSHSQLGGGVAFSLAGNSLQTVMGYGGLNYPNPATNSLELHGPLVLIEANSARGHMPGLMQPLHNAPLAHGSLLDSVPELPGRIVMLLVAGYTSVPVSFALDITGPWR